MEYLIEGFIYFWIFIIASIPNLFLGGLTFCIAATLLTYFEKRRSGGS